MKSKMGKTVCARQHCTGCSVCADVCPCGAIEIFDHLDCTEAIINSTKCIACNQCYFVCPNHRMVQQSESIEWRQGWSSSDKEREKSSSGGLAAEIAKAFVRDGGAVCSCVFNSGCFTFRMVDTQQELEEFRGSKYVKSNPKGCYREIKERILSGQKVLFIGLPCQVAAVKNFVGSKLQDHLTTVDLICHGTPSVELLKRYMTQKGKEPSKVERLLFRKDNDFFLQVDGDALDEGAQDHYTFAFLKSLTYTENCYSCRYATHLRVADITLGDSWGSSLDPEELKKGVSLVLCQNAKGTTLLHKADVKLMDVDIERAIASNQQLQHPARIPKRRKIFWKRIKSGKRLDTAVALAYPYIYTKQNVKRFLKRSFINGIRR